MMRKMIGYVSLMLTAALAVPAQVVALDLHQFWDGRCHECHGHAGDFARRHLKVEQGELIGRHHGKDLKRFLGQHEMGREHADGIYSMLLAQASTSPVFQQKCAGCHQTAAEFARTSLAVRDGILIGVTNKTPLTDFLQRHGKLAPAEIPVVVESLRRVLAETGGASTK